MGLRIDDPVTERIVRELAAATGESVATAIRKAVEERLHRLRHDRATVSIAGKLMAIGARCAALPDLDARSADDILGYDRNGLPGHCGDTALN